MLPPSYLEPFQGMENSSPSPTLLVLHLAYPAFMGAPLPPFGYHKDRWWEVEVFGRESWNQLYGFSSPAMFLMARWLAITQLPQNHSLLKPSSILFFFLTFYTTQNTQSWMFKKDTGKKACLNLLIVRLNQKGASLYLPYPADLL